jgi:PAS domain S-box-containing protein
VPAHFIPWAAFPASVALGAMGYIVVQAFWLWRARRELVHATLSLWSLAASGLLVGRLLQRVANEPEGAVRGLRVQLVSGVALLLLTILVVREMVGRPMPRRAVLALAVGGLVLLTALVPFGVSSRVIVATELGAPIYYAPLNGLGFLLLIAVLGVVGYLAIFVRANRQASGERKGNSLPLVALLAMNGLIAANDIALGLGVKTIPLFEYSLVVTALGGSYFVITRIWTRATVLETAVAERTRELEAQKATIQAALHDLARSEARFRQLAGASLEAVLVHEDGRVLDVNTAAASMLGARALGADPLDLFAPSARAVVREMLEGRAQGPIEVRALRPDGTSFSVEVAGRRNALGGRVVGIIALRDLSERDEMRARLVFADRMASLGTLAAGAAHEINNPLSYVSANLVLLAEELERPSGVPVDDARRLIDEAREGCRRVARVVKDLRSLSRDDEQDSGGARLDKVLRSAAKMVDNEVRHRAVLRLPEGQLPVVRGSDARLGQLFINLLLNAAHAIPVGDVEHNAIAVSIERPDDMHVVVAVADTGAGIAADVLDRIFEPFFTTKPVGVGMGLGLAICHGIVTSLGGEISVQSELGRGTTFRVTLLVADDAEERASQLEVVPASHDRPRRARVLIVDDDVNVGRSIARILREHDVTTALSGREAMSLADASFDVILCDLMMPDATGMDVLAYLKRERPEVAERVAFITGGAFTPQAREFLATTTARCFHKPFEPAVLRAFVQERAAEARRA